MSVFQEISDYIDTISVIDTHCHKLSRQVGFPAGIQDLVEHSYLGWCHRDWDGTKEAAAEFVRGLKHNSYFSGSRRAFRNCLVQNKGWMKIRILGLTRRLGNSLLPFHRMMNFCGMSAIMTRSSWTDIWEPGTNLGNPGLYTPTYRINQFLFGYQPDTVDDNGNNPFLVYGWPKDLEFDQYLDKIDEKITEKMAQGCVALKSSLPYDRSIHFKERTYDEAKRGYQNPDASREDIVAFQDYIYFYICRIAAKYDIPFQNHTGLGNLEGSNAMLLKEVISKNPKTRFILFHGSFPWTDDALALIHNYSNVYADLCWLPSISTTTAIYFLKQLIETGKADAITWGCDSWTVIESYGAYLAGRYAVAKALAELIEDAFMTLEEGKELAENIFRTNAKRIYDI